MKQFFRKPKRRNWLVQHLIYLEERLFGITLSDLRTLAFELAEKNSIPHVFNTEKRMARKDWFYEFLKRHPKLALRYPEKTSIASAKVFNRVAINAFFALLDSLYSKYKFSANDIYNADENLDSGEQAFKSILLFAAKNKVALYHQPNEGCL
ncbi:hypothetical protein AVEN_157809-1 [Araneus ventricosus]|uniref:HTH CENPB-type domain-containing protein n=1 Tax=Araneus ventricosus TaxID=182803 RepID=A0A4Y2IMM4_ARAVE|nr:hypothetical protein AVEN_157809-1 [Araneus ventricosus]